MGQQQGRGHGRTQETAGGANPGDQVPPGTPGSGEAICPACAGTGRRDGRECENCAGTGKITEGVGGA
jgi:DnaJ-class molecular chaperone